MKWRVKAAFVKITCLSPQQDPGRNFLLQFMKPLNTISDSVLNMVIGDVVLEYENHLSYNENHNEM